MEKPKSLKKLTVSNEYAMKFETKSYEDLEKELGKAHTWTIKSKAPLCFRIWYLLTNWITYIFTGKIRY